MKKYILLLLLLCLGEIAFSQDTAFVINYSQIENYFINKSLVIDNHNFELKNFDITDGRENIPNYKIDTDDNGEFHILDDGFTKIEVLQGFLADTSAWITLTRINKHNIDGSQIEEISGSFHLKENGTFKSFLMKFDSLEQSFIFIEQTISVSTCEHIHQQNTVGYPQEFSSSPTDKCAHTTVNLHENGPTQANATTSIANANVLYDDAAFSTYHITIYVDAFVTISSAALTISSAANTLNDFMLLKSLLNTGSSKFDILLANSFTSGNGAANASGGCMNSPVSLSFAVSIDNFITIAHEYGHLYGAGHSATGVMETTASSTVWEASSVTTIESGVSSVSACMTCTSLPVELISFQGEGINDEILLSWQTGSELNNQGFEIYHSKNGETWEMIGFVQGNGTVYETKNYEFIDKKPTKGINYYRLKQVDYDGQFEYSSIVSVFIGEKTGNNSQIFPNPATDKITISNCTGKVTLYNILGQPLEFYTDCTGNLELDISRLEKGQYIVQILNENGEVLNLKFVKNN